MRTENCFSRFIIQIGLLDFYFKRKHLIPSPSRDCLGCFSSARISLALFSPDQISKQSSILDIIAISINVSPFNLIKGLGRKKGFHHCKCLPW